MAIKAESIEKVKIEINRLNLAIEEWEKRSKIVNSYYSTPKENGNVRRKSLDLSRALAELRRY